MLVGEVGDLENPTISLPDLVPDSGAVYVGYEWINFDSSTGGWDFGPAILQFDTFSKNVGDVPLDVRLDDPAKVLTPTVAQCISWTTNLVCRERVSVGGFTWHDVHLHYHYEEFASYELRRLDDQGNVDLTDDGLIRTSPKVSYCLLDSKQMSAEASPAPRYLECNPLEGGISPGWADLYSTDVSGQSFSLEGLSDGQYALVFTLNPARRLHETDYANNRVAAIVQIDGIGTFSPDAAVVATYPI